MHDQGLECGAVQRSERVPRGKDLLEAHFSAPEPEEDFMSSFIRRLAHALDRIFVGPVSLDDQYRTPRGLTGFLVGQDMQQQHRPETLWTLDLLDVRPDQTLLEIGSGPGLLLGKIAVQLTSGRVFALDLSRSMVRMARLRNLIHLLRGTLRVDQGDAMKLPYHVGQFDSIVSVHSIYFWPEPAQVLQECRKVLRPGGKLVLTFMPRRKWPQEGAGATCHVFSEEEMVSLLQKTGFSSVKVIPGEAHFRECAVVAEV